MRKPAQGHCRSGCEQQDPHRAFRRPIRAAGLAAGQPGIPVLPESLVNAVLNEYLAAAHNDMVRKGMDRKSAAGALEGMKEEGMVEARMQAKAQAFLMALGQREGIRVSDMDVDRQIYQMAQESQQDFRKLRETVWQNGMAHDLQGRILAAKALDLMYGKAKKSTLGADGKPLTELKPEVKVRRVEGKQAAE